MSLADSIFIFGLALIIFGPKKLPEIGRQIGKIMLEFRRASNEFKMQIEEELRSVEQADRQKQFAESAAKTSFQTPEAQTPEAPVASSSESLTVRPPSTGSTESTESPYKPVSTPEEIPESTASEPAAGSLKIAETEPDISESAPYAVSESQVGESQVGEHQAGEHEISERQVSESQGLQEQTTTHHG